ncbi:hypothetical protein C0J52_25132 [Blattella germanica]|nr:hypothetical protein C0J52_25132 [Blattella germanica]
MHTKTHVVGLTQRFLGAVTVVGLLDWTRKGGWRVISSRKPVLPGDPNYPQGSQRTHPRDYAERGFKESPI